MDRLSDVEVFVRVVEHSSFVRASEQLGISRSYASRMITGLEERLGVRLLHRTTRSVTPTASGQAFYESCAPLVEGVAEAEARARAEAAEPEGTLRLALPRMFGIRHLLRPLLDFQSRHPKIRLELDFDDLKVDLIEGRYDAAIRGGAALEAPYHMRPLWPFHLMVVASPSLAKRLSGVRKPEDLVQHPAVLYTGAANPEIWPLERREERVTVTVRSSLLLNAADGQLDAVVAGAGVGLVPEWAAADALADGRLVRILPEWRSPGLHFWLVRSDLRKLPARVRTFVDFLTEDLREPPWRT